MSSPVAAHSNQLFSGDEQNAVKRSDDVFEEEIPENDEGENAEEAVRGATAVLLSAAPHGRLILLALFRVPTYLPPFKH